LISFFYCKIAFQTNFHSWHFFEKLVLGGQKWGLKNGHNQLLPIYFKISRKLNLIFDHLKLIFRKNVIDENWFKMWFYNKNDIEKRISDGRWVWHPINFCLFFFKISRKVNLNFDHLKLIFPKNVSDENRFKIWFYNKKKDVLKEIMMVDEYDTQSTFAYFFKISRKWNLIFIHLKLIFRKNVIDENRFKMWFYNKKMMSQKNLWWSMSMTPNQLSPIFSKFWEN